MIYVGFLAAIACLAGLAALVASALPLEVVEHYAGRLTTHGAPDTLFLERYARAVLFLRVSGALSVATGALLAFNGRRVDRVLRSLRASITIQWRSLWTGAADGIRATWASGRLDLLLLGAFVCFGLVLRIRFLFQPLAFDEALTYGTFASRPLLVTISHYSEPNNHIFHSVLVHLSCAMFGDTLWALRLPALVAGLLVIPASYATFRLLYSRNVALLTAGLVTSIPPMLEFSVYARGYSIVTLCFVVLLGIAAALLKGAPRLLWLPFAAVGAAGFYTVPTMLYAFGTVICWMAMSVAWDRSCSAVRPQHLLAGTLLTVLLAAVLYLPVVVVSGPRALVANRWVASVSWAEFAAALPQLPLAIASHWHRDLPAGAAIVLLAAFAAGAWWHSKESTYRVSPLLAALIWIPPAIAVQRVVPFVRTWIFLVPLYAAAIAVAFSQIAVWVSRRAPNNRTRRLVPLAASLLAISIGGGVLLKVRAFRPAGGTFVDAPDVMSRLEHVTGAGEKVVLSPASYIMFRAYARLNGIAFERYVTTADGLPGHGLAVVNEAWNETLPSDLTPAGVSPVPSAPQLLTRIGTAAIYRW